MNRLMLVLAAVTLVACADVVAPPEISLACTAAALTEGEEGGTVGVGEAETPCTTTAGLASVNAVASARKPKPTFPPPDSVVIPPCGLDSLPNGDGTWSYWCRNPQ